MKKIIGNRSPVPAAQNDNKNQSETQSALKGRKFATVVATVKKGHGVRQRRRLENTNFLLNLVENEEYSNEESFSEFVSSSSGSFDKLFSDQESMEIWNKFINKTGEEQDRYLENLDEYEEVCGTLAKVDLEQRMKENDERDEDETVDDEDFLILDGKDKREAFPAYTPLDCYRRINTRLRAFLKRRQIPKASLENHEEQLVSWFSEDPQSVWIIHLPNNYERLLLHAVSQYLDLNSASYNCNGVRQTKVENKKDSFHPPSMGLSDYLQSVR
ncbi:putative R3H domain-containing protein 4 [Apostichopus japonicus]|uniref:Putative R3H domain-containing protein 4 n=1 Tax=Stichopus japonicus TaxID=307972 RepID=A0A2G8KQD6_STIJA|nr:putative R3H domain-containing protein 4 [Apostichopus japonicus]